MVRCGRGREGGREGSKKQQGSRGRVYKRQRRKRGEGERATRERGREGGRRGKRGIKRPGRKSNTQVSALCSFVGKGYGLFL